MVEHALGKLAFEADAVQRLDMAVLGLHHHIGHPAQVVLHRADFGQAVQRADHEEGIAQPAEAIVPVAAAVRRFRDAGGHRGDDRAGLLVQRHLQRDGGADHRVLPFARHRQPACPQLPVRDGLLLEVARGLVDAVLQRLVGAEDEVHALRDQERRVGHHIGQRRVGRHPQRHVVADEADMAAAARGLRLRAAPVEARRDRHAHARRALDRADPPHQRQRTEIAAQAEEARREIGDLETVAVAVGQPRAQHRGVRLVPLARFGEVLDLDREMARVLARVEQRVEDRIAIEAWQAAPDDAAARIDQRGERAIADHAQR